MKTKKVVKKLVKALDKDSGYYYSWQANIAMAFQDAYWDHFKDKSPRKFPIHQIANTAAINFLNQLLYAESDRVQNGK